jgi:hypothetical protein
MTGYTARELAAMGLPGVPRKVRKVLAKAKREEWRYTERQVRGGTTRVYEVASLPRKTQAALARIAAARGAEPTEGAELAEAPEAFRQIASERLTLVRAVEELVRNGVSRAVAYATVAEDTEHSARSVQRWYLATRELPESERLTALLPSWRSGATFAACHPEAWEYFKSDYLRPARPAYAACYRRLLTIAQAKAWAPIPSLHSLRRRLEAEVDHAAIVAAREGDEVLARLYPAQERSKDHLRALQAVNADGHRFDVMVRWPDGEVSRPVLVGFQDVHSGKILSWRLDKTEHGDLVRLAFGDLVEHFGVPEACYLDNGRGFANKWLTGQSAWRFRFKTQPGDPKGVLLQLGVSVHWTTPYHGQAKPIERAWRDLCEDIARHPACEGAYTGSDTTDKPHNYGSRAVELDTFVQLVQVCINEHNAREKRRAKVCAGRSFDATFEASYASAPIRRITEEQRRLLFLAAEAVSVRQQTGEVHLLGNRYWADKLVGLCGERVVLRFDPQNAKRGVYVYRLGGEFVCFAECIEAAGFDDRSQARDHARKRTAWAKAQKKVLEAERSMTASDLEALHLEAALGAPPKRARSKVARIEPAVPRVAPTREERDRRERNDEFIDRIGRNALAKLTPRRSAVGE